MKKLFSLLLLVFFLIGSSICAFASNESTEQTYGILRGEKEIPLHGEPHAEAEIIGYFLPNTKVEVLQELGAWFEIMCGELSIGFVESNNLEIWECEPIPFVGMPIAGCVVISADSQMSNQEAPRYQFPNLESPQIEIATSYTGQTLPLLSVLGDWCQVRTVNDLTIGFVEAKNVDIYLLDDLFPDSQVGTVDFGSYKVETDISEGLYRVATTSTGETQVSISGTNSTFDKVHTIQPDTLYTVFLPEAADVTMSGDGSFTSVGSETKLHNNEGVFFSGNGRFMMGVELPYTDEGYILKNLDNSQSAYYRLTNISNTYFDNEEPTFVEIPPNSSTALPFQWGVFVEIRNCIIEADEVNG